MSTTRPSSINIARSQNRRTASIACVTRTIVLPSFFRRRNASLHFSGTPLSPTASTSSSNRTSPSTWIEIEKARRMSMPEE